MTKRDCPKPRRPGSRRGRGPGRGTRRGRGRRFAHRIQKRMFVRILFGFLFTMLLTAVAITFYHHFTQDESRFMDVPEKVAAFVGHRFDAVWDDEEKRAALATEISEAFALGITLFDADGEELLHRGPQCRGRRFKGARFSRKIRTGKIEACLPRPRQGQRRGFGGLVVALMAILAGSMFLAKRLSRPLTEIARVAEAIGQGDLSARVVSRGRNAEEIDVVAGTVNTMAERIQNDLEEQRTLLATVSHEMRTPLGHLRLLSEMARDAKTDEKRERALVEIDDEIDAMARLTDGLLAHSRLAFDIVERAPHDVVDLCQRELARVGRDDVTVAVAGTPRVVSVDANLMVHAISNLIGNAQRHGQGARALEVAFTADGVSVTVDDAGPGVAPTVQADLFAPFQRTGSKAGGLGLGLSLVRRIADAHGGTVTYEDVPSGGARFVLTLPDGGPTQTAAS